MTTLQSKGPKRAPRQHLSILELTSIFLDEESTRKWFESVRWEDGRFCGHCGSLNTYKTRSGKPQRYRCYNCGRYFSVKTGTVMQSSRLPLRTWAFGIYFMVSSPKGIPSTRLAANLGVTQSTAWTMAHRIREGWRDSLEDTIAGEVEVDETYIGGLEKNKHSDKKLHIGGGVGGKAVVMGARERKTGEVRVAHVASARKGSLQGFIREYVERGSRVYTDTHKSYENLKGGYRHRTVTHSIGQYVDGDVHTNGIESFWATVKRTHKGTYHSMSDRHLHRYMIEMAGRHNNRNLDVLDQMAIIILGMEDRTLRWRHLIPSSK